MIWCRLKFYCVDVNTVPHKLVTRAGVTVSFSWGSNNFGVLERCRGKLRVKWEMTWVCLIVAPSAETECISNYWLWRLQRFALQGVSTQAILGSFVNWVIHILHMFAVLTSFDEFIAHWERKEKLDSELCQGFELWALSAKAKMPKFVLSKRQLERLDCNYQIYTLLQ